MNKRKTTFNRIIMSVTFAAIIVMAARTDFGQFKAALLNLQYKWLAIGVLAVVLSWVIEAIVLKRLISGISGTKAGFGQCIKYTMAMLYYFAITPYGSAGQPMQMVYMMNDGYSLGKTSAIAGVKLLSDKVSLVLIYIIFMVLSGQYFYSNYRSLVWVSISAFAINLVMLICTAILIVKPDFTRQIFKGCLRLLCKLNIIKNPKKAIEKTDKAIKDYSLASAFIKNNKKKSVELVLLSSIKRLLVFVLPYLIYRAFGLSDYSMLTILALNIFMSLAVSLMPTPGASVAAEGGFTLIFTGMFGAAIVPAVVIWRLLTYYLVIAAGSMMTFVKALYEPRDAAQKNRMNNLLFGKR